jgi:hypothetical protein
VQRWLAPDEVFVWRSVDGPSGAQIDVDELSNSQRKWARLAIALAAREMSVASRQPGPWWLCMDEPEAGIHRTVSDARSWVGPA